MPRAPAAKSPPAAYLVLGMHRSGTSAVTQLLALAGADLPANLMPGDEHNAKGYFEPWRIAIFNDQRLRAGGGAWDDPFLHPYRGFGRAEERRWANRAMALFEEEYGQARHPLLKDPRVTVLAPLWLTVLADLEITPRAVIPVRHPLAVAGSLAKRNGFPPEKSVLLWCAYMLAAENASRGLPRAIVSYDALLSDWRGEVERIEAGHGAPLPRLTQKAGKAIDDFLTTDLRHNAPDAGLGKVPQVGRLAEKVHDWFEAAARGEAPDAAVLDEATATLAVMRRQMGVFVSPVSRDLDVAKSELLDARQMLDFQRRQSEAEKAAASEAHRSELAALQAEIDAYRVQLAGLQDADRLLGELLGAR